MDRNILTWLPVVFYFIVLLIMLSSVYILLIEKQYETLIIATTIFLLFSFIHRSEILMGTSDIYKEMFVVNYSVRNGFWDPLHFVDNYNTVMSITCLPVFLNFIFPINSIIFLGYFSQFIIIICVIYFYFSVKHYNSGMKYNASENSIALYAFLITGIFISIGTFTQIYANALRGFIALLFFYGVLHTYYSQSIPRPKNMQLRYIFFIGIIVSHWGSAIMAFAALGPAYFLQLFKNGQMKKILLSKRIGVPLIIGLFAMVFYGIVTSTVTDLLIKVIKTIIQEIFFNVDFSNPSYELLISLIFPNITSFSLFVESMSNFILLSIISLGGLLSLRSINKHSEIQDYFLITSLLIVIAFTLISSLSHFYGGNRVFLQLFLILQLGLPKSLLFLDKTKARTIKNRKIFPTLKKNQYKTIFLLLLISIYSTHQGIMYIVLSDHDDRANPGINNYGDTYNRWFVPEEDIDLFNYIKDFYVHDETIIITDAPRFFTSYYYIDSEGPNGNWLYERTFISLENIKMKYSSFYLLISKQNIDSQKLYFLDDIIHNIHILDPWTENSTLMYNSGSQLYYFEI
ncbi:MAG: hypothetical protein INQ03_24405 [Candidatus Heimdallarchaeota archaeon]|nr:hypothetical protein [Candidatus Heimdallarchaeota archaeon]